MPPRLRYPAFNVLSPRRGIATVQIKKIGTNSYFVDSVHVKNNDKVKWEALGLGVSEIVVFFPSLGRPLSEPELTVHGNPGKYHYALFVKVRGHFIGVEGNSPPEMVIE